jgi:hypothetical protein
MGPATPRGLMPRYFFHMTDGLGRTTDHAGSYFRIEKEARDGALEAAKQILAGRMINGRWINGRWMDRSGGLERGGHIEVADEQGCVRFTVPLAQERPGKLSNSAKG